MIPPQGGAQPVRQLPVDLPTVSLWGDAPTAPSRPGRQASKRHRRAKLVSSFALALLVGLGSYALTYRVLVVVSTPAAAPANGPVVPAHSGGGTTATVPVTATPVQPPS